MSPRHPAGRDAAPSVEPRAAGSAWRDLPAPYRQVLEATLVRGEPLAEVIDDEFTRLSQDPGGEPDDERWFRAEAEGRTRLARARGQFRLLLWRAAFEGKP